MLRPVLPSRALPPRALPLRVLLLGCLGLLLAGCGSGPSDRLTAPELGACRPLDAEAVATPADDTEPVPCTDEHTAQTFLVGTLPEHTGASYDDKRHGKYVYRACTPAFAKFLGADDSLAMRVQLSWAWFRPSERGWERGARWFRCDLLGGPAGAERLRPLPENARGLFTDRRPDAWLSCARGADFSAATKLACSEPHDWRAIATVKLGEPDDPYPGDRLSEVHARDYCADQVGAWTNYTPDYAYAYTWFHEAEWEAGVRRAICWARTDQ